MNFHVADWYVDIDTNRIHCGEDNIKLEDKVMTLLVYLARHQGKVLSREQLEADVWTDRVISYDALTSCITRLRKALGDDSRKPLFIETVPKKGYRLIAPVRWVDEKTLSVASDAAVKASYQGLFLGALLSVFVVVAAVFSFIAIRPDGDIAPPNLTDLPTIVVKSFDNLSQQSSQDYFSDGITADISIALSKLSGLRVIATPTAYTRNSEPLSVYSLTGSVQRVDKQLRVNVILIDNRSHHQLWAESYHREMTKVFDVQDEITQKIVSTLSIKLTEEEKKRVAHRYTNNIRAYDQFLRGQALYTQRTSNENALARQHYLNAIELDPGFSRAYSSLSLTHVDDYRHRWVADGKHSLAKAVSLAKKAISLDENLPQALWAYAYALMHAQHYRQAMQVLDEALLIRPNYSDGYAFLALIYIYSGDPVQGMKLIRRAMRLNPNYPAHYLSVLGQAHYSLGEYEDVLTVLRTAINKNFGLVTAHVLITATLSQLDRHDEAIWSADQLHAVSPEFQLRDVARITPFKDEKDLKHIIENLRAAGINE